MLINCYAAWVGMLSGCVAGALPGLLFQHPEWLGGYAQFKPHGQAHHKKGTAA